MKHPLRIAIITLPAVAFAAACSDSPFSGEPPGEDACARLAVPGIYAGDVRLDVGDATRLASGTQLCLVLPGSAANEYALAWVDTRAIEAARTAPEPFGLDSVSITVGAAGSTRATRLVAERKPGEPSDVREIGMAAAESDDPMLRATPWTQGEHFALRDVVRATSRPATVQRVYDGWLVIATFNDQPEPKLAGMLQNLDTAWPSLRSAGIPLLQKVLSQQLPVTSNGSGQLLVVVRSDLEGAAGVAFGGTDGTHTLTQIAILPYDNPSSSTFVGSLLFHEVTHAFQRIYTSSTRPSGAPPTLYAGTSRWAIEGGASLMQAELGRRLAGVQWAANWDFRAPSGAMEQFYTRFAYVGSGPFVRGYSTSSAFMQDLVARRVQRGEAVDDALTAVMRGSLEGWFGHGPQGAQRTGLTARMRSSLGAGWEPEDAMLTWTLSHAADDRTSSSVFQNRSFLRVWDGSDAAFWPAAASLAPGSAAVTVKHPHESTGHFALAGGGTYTLSSSVDGVRWMIVRVK
jgi:hypothetical protein